MNTNWKLNPAKKKQLIIGIAQNISILLVFSIAYQSFLIELVRAGQLFWGSDTLFFTLLLVFPILNLVKRNFSALLGNLVGSLLFILIINPLTMLVN